MCDQIQTERVDRDGRILVGGGVQSKCRILYLILFSDFRVASARFCVQASATLRFDESDPIFGYSISISTVCNLKLDCSPSFRKPEIMFEACARLAECLQLGPGILQ